MGSQLLTADKQRELQAPQLCLTWVPSMDVSAFRSRKNLVAVEGRHLAVLELAGVWF